jgi:phospholipid/cholesterol/gamma-HCH transport system substrate-binding protein
MPDSDNLDLFREGRVRARVITLFILGLLAALTLTLAIAYRHDSLGNTANVYFITDSAAGLPEGTAVTMSGFRVGRVSEVTLLPDLKVRVDLAVRAEYLRLLREDAAAELVKEDLLKPHVIALVQGEAKQLLAPQNPRIKFERPESFADMAGELKSKIAPILDDVKQITGTVKTHQHRLAEIMEQAARATHELANAAREINALSADARTQVTGIGGQTLSAVSEVNRTVTQLNGVIRQAEQAVATANSSLPQLLREANGTLESLQAVARDARVISAAAADNVPGILQNAKPAAEDVRNMVRGATQTWPMSEFMPGPPPMMLTPGSLDAKVMREATSK